MYRYLASGELDSSFSGDGVADDISSYGFSTFSGSSLAIDSQGRIVIAGGVSHYNPSTGDITSSPVAARLTPDGSRDPSFGENGVFGAGGNFFFFGVAIAAGDRPVLSGGADDTYLLVRLDASGDPDATFGPSQNGTAQLSVPGGGGAHYIDLDAAGRIVTMGQRLSSFVVRFTASGSPDGSFDDDGVLNIDDRAGATGYRLATDSQSRIVVLTPFTDPVNLDSAAQVVRLTTSGALDMSFDGDGKAQVDVTDDPNETAGDLTVDGADRPVLVVSTDAAGETEVDLHAVRLTSGGAPDSVFSQEGIASAHFDARGSAIAVALGTGDAPVILGTLSPDGGLEQAALARFESDGDPDAGFSGDGKVVTSATAARSDVATSAEVDASGRILTLIAAARSVDAISDADAVLERRTAAGERDTTFGGGDGVVEIENADPADLAVDSLGRLLVLSRAEDNTTLVLRRFTASGAPDNDFSTDSAVTVDGWVSFTHIFEADLAVDASDRPIVTGATLASDNLHDYAVWRFTAAGEPDTSFSGDGLQTVAFEHANQVSNVALDGSGRIVLAGCAGLARLAATGALDATFSGDGRADTAELPAASCPFDMAIDGSDRLLLGLGLSVARITAAGALDTTFSEDGFGQFDIVFGDAPSQALDVDSAGRVVTAGQLDGFGPAHRAVGRLTADGMPDTSFDAGGDGMVTTDFAGSPQHATDMTVMPDGRIVTVGYTGYGSAVGPDVAISRYVGTSAAGQERTLTAEVEQSFGQGGMTAQGIDCPGDCTATFALGDVAEPRPKTFSGAKWTWSGADAECVDDNSDCYVSMDADRTVGLTFTGGTGRTLTVVLSGAVGGGKVIATGIDCGSDCSETYPFGSEVQLTAVPNAGYVFTGWSNCGTGTCSLTMTSDTTITATFAAAGGPGDGTAAAVTAAAVATAGAAPVASTPAAAWAAAARIPASYRRSSRPCPTAGRRSRATSSRVPGRPTGSATGGQPRRRSASPATRSSASAPTGGRR